MSALTASKPVARATTQDLESYGVVAAVKIYEGSFVGANPAGYIQPLQAGDLFRGIAYELADNTSGAAGAIKCRVHTSGDFQLPFAGALADIGKPIFATTDNDLSLSGNMRSWVGWIIDYIDSATVMVRLRRPGEVLHNGVWGQRLRWDGARGFAPVLTAGGEQFIGGEWRVDAIGAGIVAVGVAPSPTEGETRMLLDNDNEAENLTIESPYFANITKGIYARFKLRLKTAGGAATDDVDFGIGALSTTGLTDTERANMDATTAGLKTAKFHLDANANDVFFSSDDDTSPVAAVDTTFDNELTVNHVFEIFARPGGAVEVWIDGVRKLSSTAFAVSATGIFALFINEEKSTGTGVPEVRVVEAEIVGALA